jgi:hypothetical protein
MCSARAHTVENGMDAVLDYRWPEHFGGWNFAEWKEILGARRFDGDEDLIRHATLTGEPLGSRRFGADFERHAGRRLRALERGRPRKPAELADGQQTCLFE